VSTHEYSGVAVRTLFLASVEQEINHASSFSTVFIYYFRFWAVILAIWLVVILFLPYHLVALPYLAKVTKVFPLTSSSYEMAAERMACGVILSHPFNIWMRVTLLWARLGRHAWWVECYFNVVCVCHCIERTIPLCHGTCFTWSIS